jgi:hypothetical protein
MIFAKALTMKKDLAITSAQFLVLTVLATVAPLLGHNQAVTGPIVNAALFIAVALLGAQNAILVGLIPSVVALSAGLLPAVLAPMIPFIMISNTVLIITFAVFKRRNFWLGVLMASVFKFIFLIGTSTVVSDLIVKQEIAQKAVSMMSWPQLATALAGGLIAYLILKGIKKE